ncbi:MAG: TAXI family TRAP transporter solute-binding subunit [Acetobacteraceae bacterium]|nr:TAXI family TRAP transporter solute-binding subunit [Acetobacteraceae bacterium]MCX7684330.1 TAXI family TRAP transporter solute-binding subunit [Acetobacteraceae bacterium]MDW8398825.1 TAXI family TRAP transporter solute-binding subunit [Acetobacteraceae bacterium]
MRIGIIAAAGLFAAALAQPAAAQPMGIGSSPQGTLTYAMAAAFANTLRETANIQARVQPQSGTGVMLPLINSGELDFGFVNTLELSEAYNGTGSHQGRPQRNLRAAAVMMPIQVGIFVRNDSPIRTLEDLRGRRIAQGFTAQAVIQTVLEGVLANGGLTPADIRPVQVPNLIRGVDEFIAGNADAAFFALGQAKVAEADAAVGGIRFIPLSTDAEAVARMRRIVAPSYIGVVQPAANLPGVREPLPTMFYDYVMVVNASLPAARVQTLVATLHDQRDRLAQAVPIFRQLDTSRLYGRTDAPFHEGALAFFRARNIAQVQ